MAALALPGAARAEDPPPAAIAYGIGVSLKKVIETCDVSTTAAQRSAVTQKVAALRAALSPALAAGMDKQPVPADCPAASGKDQEEFRLILGALLDKSPEQFVAFVQAGPDAGSTPPPAAAAADDATAAGKRGVLGGALALRYEVELCDIPTTGQQRTAIDVKIKALTAETGMTAADLDQVNAAIKNRIKADLCPGYRDMFPGMLSALQQDLPPDQWATHAANQASAGSTKKVGEWTVNVQSCDMTYSYYDKNDKNRLNGVFFGRTRDGVKIVVQYENWKWDAGDKLTSKLSFNDKLVNASTSWTAPQAGQYLTAQFDGSLLPFIATANTITLGFEKGDAEFNIPGAGEAIRSLEGCAAR